MVKMLHKVKSAVVVILVAGMFSGIVLNPVVASTEGWKKDTFGWQYQNTDGSYLTNQWRMIDGVWYYFNAKGYMLENAWTKDKTGKWYYLGSNGEMKIDSWIKDQNGAWYYVGSDGSMKANAWVKDKNGTWYYVGVDGIMKTNAWAQDKKGQWYYLGTDGAMAKGGFVDYEGNKYLVDVDGIRQTGVIKLKDSAEVYFFRENGIMVTGTVEINGEEYHFNEFGLCIDKVAPKIEKELNLHDSPKEEIKEESNTEKTQDSIYTYTDLTETLYAKESLNVRDLPSTSGNIIGLLRAGEKVQITGQCNETRWYRIVYNGMVGYCSNKYLVTQPSQNVQENSSQSEVNRVINEINTYWNQDVTISWDDSTFSKSDKQKIAICIAQNVAKDIESRCSTDYEKANAAAAFVAELCKYTPYTTDDPDYSTAYGVFVCKAYTCAGATRAVGLILDQMGISWTHANQNQWTHQWNIITNMDGQGIGWADGMVGFADYGEHVTGNNGFIMIR